MIGALLVAAMLGRAAARVGFLPEETYFFQDGGKKRFFPEEMEETGRYGRNMKDGWHLLWSISNSTKSQDFLAMIKKQKTDITIVCLLT